MKVLSYSFYELIMLPKALPTFSCQNCLPPLLLLWMFNIISSDISHSSFNDDTKSKESDHFCLIHELSIYDIYFVSLHTTPSRLLEHLLLLICIHNKVILLMLSLLLLRLHNHLILQSWWDECKIFLWSHPWGKKIESVAIQLQ